MNRTQRRQMERALGNRGSKAKRKGQPRPDRMPQMAGGLHIAPVVADQGELSAAQVDHLARQDARNKGLLVPPSAQEREALRHQGQRVPLTDSGLIVPSGG